MKRLTFTVDLDVEDDYYDVFSKPYDLARSAMTYGDKHQPWAMSLALAAGLTIVGAVAAGWASIGWWTP